MKNIHLDLQNPRSVERAVQLASEILGQGGVMVYPTDTVYGLGTNALDERAIEKVFLIKERVKQKPISVAVKDVAMARRIAVVSAVAEKFLARVWPGAVTVILPKRSVAPDILTGGGPIGLRCFKNDFLEMLFSRIDFPLTTTSANISGEPPVSDIRALRAQFKNKKHLPDLIVDAGTLRPSPASTVIDITGNEPKMVRVGPVSPQELIRLFNDLKKK
ncbi:MAG: L-threonylcarbamoyladenylate synthase [bacterium]|nr:L-threonylcarbamoyladenylate synthase [bacterium]